MQNRFKVGDTVIPSKFQDSRIHYLNEMDALINTPGRITEIYYGINAYQVHGYSWPESALFPVKWAVERTGQNYEYINKWANKYYDDYSIRYAGKSEFIHSEKVRKMDGFKISRAPFVYSSFTEISFEEFKKHVLKKDQRFFDLEKAQAGSRIKYQNGHDVKTFHVFNGAQIIVSVDMQGVVHAHHMNGSDKQDSEFDLVMDTKKEYWVNMYRYPGGEPFLGCCTYSSEENAKKVCDKDCEIIATLKVYEEK